jgi:hypothetical protein
MHSSREETTTFHLFDSTGVGLIGLDESGRILQLNDSLLRYLDLEGQDILGKKFSSLKEQISFPGFWEALDGERPFYCLVPGSSHLLLTICRGYAGPRDEGISKIVILRPFGLEREFIRMRARLSRNSVFEISSHLSSLAIAGDIILQPELQEDETTRQRFLSTFFKDINDLSELFNGLQEIAEPISFPNRVRFSPLDWKGLIADLLEKMQGLANEKNVSLSKSLTSCQSSPRGDYHWLYLAFYTLVDHALKMAAPLSEVKVGCTSAGGQLETIVEYERSGEAEAAWPPRTLFHLSEEDPRIGKMALTDLALSRSIFLLHHGDVRLIESGGISRIHVRLPL